MLFRYKITKSNEWIHSSLSRVHYNVTIQYYDLDALFSWKNFDTTTLKDIAQKYSRFEFLPYTDGINEVYTFISNYSNMDEIMEKYITDIKKEKLSKEKCDQESKIKENEIDKLVLTNSWNTIEIKENE